MIIGFILVALVAGNNLSVCSGTIIASKTVSKKQGVLLTIAGYIAGLILEGKFLSGIGLMIPKSNYFYTLILFAIAIVLFILAYKLRIPQSLSIIFTSLIIGMDIALNITIHNIFLLKLFLFWFIAPVISIIFSLIIIQIGYKRRSKNIFKTLKFIKLFSIIFAFLSAFTLGANTIGLLLVAMPNYIYSVLALIFGIIFGSVFLNKQGLNRISNEIISLRYLNSLISQASSFLFVEIATIFGIPVSSTQIFITSLYGIAFGNKQRVLIKKTLFSIISSWVLMIFIGIVFAFLIFHFLK